jgi:hypothetical protein
MAPRGLSVIFRSVDLWIQQRGNRVKYARVSCFCVPAHGYAAVLERRETLLENAAGGVRVHRRTFKTYLMAGLKTALGGAGYLTLPQLCQNYMPLCVRIGKMTRSASNAPQRRRKA